MHVYLRLIGSAFYCIRYRYSFSVKAIMPGYKVFLEDNGDVRKGLKCSYCNLLLNDPVQTSESGLRFCRECFKDAKKLVDIKDQ